MGEINIISRPHIGFLLIIYGHQMNKTNCWEIGKYVFGKFIKVYLKT
jgi:hypothetical protein